MATEEHVGERGDFTAGEIHHIMQLKAKLDVLQAKYRRLSSYEFPLWLFVLGACSLPAALWGNTKLPGVISVVFPVGGIIAGVSLRRTLGRLSVEILDRQAKLRKRYQMWYHTDLSDSDESVGYLTREESEEIWHPPG